MGWLGLYCQQSHRYCSGNSQAASTETATCGNYGLNMGFQTETS